MPLTDASNDNIVTSSTIGITPAHPTTTVITQPYDHCTATAPVDENRVTATARCGTSTTTTAPKPTTTTGPEPESTTTYPIEPDDSLDDSSTAGVLVEGVLPTEDPSTPELDPLPTDGADSTGGADSTDVSDNNDDDTGDDDTGDVDTGDDAAHDEDDVVTDTVDEPAAVEPDDADTVTA